MKNWCLRWLAWLSPRPKTVIEQLRTLIAEHDDEEKNLSRNRTDRAASAVRSTR